MLNDVGKRVGIVYAERMDGIADAGALHTRIGILAGILRDAGYEPTCIERGDLCQTISGFDWVLAAGGDGTMLDAARYLETVPICGVRLFPGSSVGYLCSMDYDEFLAVIPSSGLENMRIKTRRRLMCLVDGAALSEPILNDILVAHSCPARASRYEIVYGDVRQTHCSSGIWVATAAGSHGACQSAGAQALDEEKTDDGVFCVRELSRYAPQTGEPLRMGAFYPPSGLLRIRVMSSGHRAFFDGGLSVHDLDAGQCVEFTYHRYGLNQIVM